MAKTTTTTTRKKPATPSGAKPHPQPKPTKRTTTATTTPKSSTRAQIDKALAEREMAAGVESPLMSEIELAIRGQDVRSRMTRRGYKTANGMLGSLSDSTRYSDDTYRALQEQLYLGGFYTTNNREAIRWGDRRDTATRAAFAEALATAMLYDVTIEDVLEGKAKFASQALRGGGGPKIDPFVAQLPNPDDIRAVADKIAPSELGRTLSPDQVALVINEYNAVVTRAQRSAYDANLTGGTVTEPPDLGTFINEKAKQLNPQEYDLFQKFSLVGDVTRLLGLGGAVQQGNL